MIRPATADDAAAVEEVRVAGWRAAYRGMVPAAFLADLAPDVPRRRQWLAQPGPGTVALVAVEGGEVVGFVVAGPGRDTDDDDPARATHEVYACYVHPERWRGGVGRGLLRTALQRLGPGATALWVLADNAAARRFYETEGFVADGARRTLDLGGPVAEVRYVRRSGPPVRDPGGEAPGAAGPAAL